MIKEDGNLKAKQSTRVWKNNKLKEGIERKSFLPSLRIPRLQGRTCFEHVQVISVNSLAFSIRTRDVHYWAKHYKQISIDSIIITSCVCFSVL